MTPERLIPSYGRRRGRPLRASRAALVDTLLPKLAIAPPTGVVDPKTLFARPVSQVWLEIGFGAGEHLAAQAIAHRDVGIIGSEIYLNGIASLLARVDAARIDNLRLWPRDARELLPALADASIARAFVLFPDPWPKARHLKRRLIVPSFLDQLARLMPAGAELRIATDIEDYLTGILACLLRHPAFAWQAQRAADWRVRPGDWPPTRYEAKAIAAGRVPTYLRFLRRPAEQPESP